MKKVRITSHIIAYVMGVITLVAVAFVVPNRTGSETIAAPESNTASTVTILEPGAEDGYVLVAPFLSHEASAGKGIVYLTEKTGKVAHKWNTNYPVAGYADLLPDGDLIYVGKTEFVARGGIDLAFVGGAGVIQRLGWDSTVKWTIEDSLVHHDFALLPDGSMATLRWTPLSPAFADKVIGGQPNTELKGQIWADEIIEVSASGVVRTAWRAEDSLDPDQYRLPDFMNRNEWTHANSIRYVPVDPISGKEAYLVSFRQLSVVMLIDRETGDVIWSYGGPGLLHQQHDPSLLSDGTILIYDNGQYRYDPPAGAALPTSRVVQIDPRTNSITWSYSGPGALGWRFFSPIVSGAQRLENGNTLITEGLPGRLFEVTSSGKIVWEYLHPYGVVDRILFKARSYPASLVQPLLRGASP